MPWPELVVTAAMFSCLKGSPAQLNTNSSSKESSVKKGKEGMEERKRRERSEEEMVMLMKPKMVIKNGDDGADQSRERGRECFHDPNL